VRDFSSENVEKQYFKICLSINSVLFNLLDSLKFIVVLGSVHKDVRSQERFVQCGPFADKEEGGFSDADVPHFLAQKTPGFSKFRVCPHGQGGLSQCGQGERCQFFAILCGRFIGSTP